MPDPSSDSTSIGYHFDAGKFALFLQRKVTESLVLSMCSDTGAYQSTADGAISGLSSVMAVNCSVTYS